MIYTNFLVLSLDPSDYRYPDCTSVNASENLICMTDFTAICDNSMMLQCAYDFTLLYQFTDIKNVAEYFSHTRVIPSARVICTIQNRGYFSHLLWDIFLNAMRFKCLKITVLRLSQTKSLSVKLK